MHEPDACFIAHIIYTLYVLRSLLLVEKEHYYYRLIGVFWLRAGDDRLDVVPFCGFNS